MRYVEADRSCVPYDQRFVIDGELYTFPCTFTYYEKECVTYKGCDPQIRKNRKVIDGFEYSRDYVFGNLKSLVFYGYNPDIGADLFGSKERHYKKYNLIDIKEFIRLSKTHTKDNPR